MNQSKFILVISIFIALSGVIVMIHQEFSRNYTSSYNVITRIVINSNIESSSDLDRLIKIGQYDHEKLSCLKHRMIKNGEWMYALGSDYASGKRWKYRFYGALMILVAVLLQRVLARGNNSEGRGDKQK